MPWVLMVAVDARFSMFRQRDVLIENGDAMVIVLN